jgi:hypothetical protein
VLLVAVIVLVAAQLLAQSPILQLRIDQIMSQREMQDTGVSTLTPAQRRALNEWLNRYTIRVMEAALKPSISDTTVGRTSCSPAIESTISGEINGWDGETVFKLDNGQIWEQAEYSYTYFYAYRPDVTIYQTSSGCRMKVEDEDETILVRRIK